MGPWFDISSEPEKLLGRSRAIRKIKKQIKIAASYDYPILISGETGVGKTLIAYIIHSASKRRGKPFLHQSCSNISSELLESELFGHEKGAFTGATERKKGKIEIADGGTLFLDEISDLSLGNQAKLLQFLERGKFFRVGGNEELTVDVRILAASNRNLEKEIKKGKFREDLYYRLNTLEIHIPSLKERRENIPLIADEILRGENERNEMNKSISSEAMTRLLAHDYPGNVRELENIIKRAFVNSKGSEIKPDDVIFSKCRFVDKKEQKVASEQIQSTLRKYRGNKSRAAKELGISRQWLHRIIKKKKL